MSSLSIEFDLSLLTEMLWQGVEIINLCSHFGIVYPTTPGWIWIFFVWFCDGSTWEYVCNFHPKYIEYQPKRNPSVSD